MILLGNVPGKKRKHNGYYVQSILKNKMDISTNQVNMVNNGENNGARCNVEMMLSGGHCESNFSLSLLSRPTIYSEMSATYGWITAKSVAKTP